MPTEVARQYVVFDSDRLITNGHDRHLTAADINEAIWPLLAKTDTRLSSEDYRVESVPLVTFVPGDLPDCQWPQRPTQGVFAVTSPDPAAASRFRNTVLAAVRMENSPLLRIGIDPAVSLSEYSLPVAPDAELMGTWQDAHRLIKAGTLGDNGLDGFDVNVIVIDAGLDRSIVPTGQFGGGWHPDPGDPAQPPSQLPGMTTGIDGLHGMMIVTNILAPAPQARIFDVPLIRPPKIGDVPTFIDLAEETYRRILNDIPVLANSCGLTKPWIFVNAWTIYDRRSELSNLGEYTENAGNSGVWPHPFIARIGETTRAFDVVFCAGNCGEVCPDGRCGPNDFGPGRSIWGAAAYRRVLSVGAVRVDGMWCGYSSEGPGPVPNLSYNKPDFCAPSQFVSAQGGFPLSTGSSASAGVTAGAVVALRSGANWNQTTVSPDDLQQSLNDTAQRPPAGIQEWDMAFSTLMLRSKV